MTVPYRMNRIMLNLTRPIAGDGLPPFGAQVDGHRCEGFTFAIEGAAWVWVEYRGRVFTFRVHDADGAPVGESALVNRETREAITSEAEREAWRIVFTGA